MASLIITILWALVAICVLVGIYYLVLWVLQQLGIPIPDMAIKICLIIICLLILIYLISALFGGARLVM